MRFTRPQGTAWTLGIALTSTLTLAQPVIIDLGVIGNAASSSGQGLSETPLSVVGTLDGGAFPNFFSRAYQWTARNGMTDLGLLEGWAQASATDVSYDGGVVVGTGFTGQDSRACRWTLQGGNWNVENLGLLPNFATSRATATSADGQTVVGYCTSPTASLAFRWTPSQGMQSLGTPDQGSIANDVNPDGTMVVGGMSNPVNQTTQAFRWTAQTGLVPLGPIPGHTSAEAMAISHNGLAITGASGPSPTLFGAFRWTNLTGMQPLPSLPSSLMTRPWAINGDGSAIAGTSSGFNGASAFYWTAQIGSVNLNTYLPQLGLPLTGWTLQSATAMSQDGTSLTGTGVFNGQTRAWLVTGLPAVEPACQADCDHSGILSIDDLMCFQTLFALGDPIADCDDSGSLDIDDFLCFQTLFAAGC